MNEIRTLLEKKWICKDTDKDLYYRVRSACVDDKSQKGAYKDLDGAVDECKKHRGYHVYDATGRQVYPVIDTKPPYRVRKSWGSPDSQIGAYEELENAIELARANEGYRVYDANSKIIPIPSS